MIRRRYMVAGSLALLAFAGGVAGILIDRADFLDLKPGSQTVSVTIGRTRTAEFTIHNRHPWRTAKIEFVKAQCGCFRVGTFPTEVAPGESATITLDMFILPTGDRIDNTLQVHLVGGDRLEAEISAEPIVPFPGWPEHAVGVFDGTSGTIFFDIAPTYRDRIVLAQGFTHVGMPIETLFDPELGTIVLSDPGVGGTLAVTFTTEDGDSTWTGEIDDQRHRYVSPSP